MNPFLNPWSISVLWPRSGWPQAHRSCTVAADDLQQAEIVLFGDLELLRNQLPELAFGQQAGEESTALLIFKRLALQRQAQ